jgi:hypothetical protein
MNNCKNPQFIALPGSSGGATSTSKIAPGLPMPAAVAVDATGKLCSLVRFAGFAIAQA